MKKNLLSAALFVLSVLGLPLTAAENLLPAVENTNKIWYQARNAECNAKFSCDVENSILRLESSTDIGYANYRCNLKLAPGDYTADILINGNCVKAAAGMEVYSFDAAGKATLIGMRYFPEGRLTNERMAVSFRVPADSVNVRFGLSLNARGKVEFVKPALYRGNMELGDLPPREGVPGARLKANYDRWEAEWLWVKDVYEISKASFIKRFNISSPVVAAMVQLSADNGYELYVNGQFVGADGNWQTSELYDIASLLKEGENNIEFIGENFDGLGGLILQGQIWFADGSTMDLLTSKDWELFINGERRQEQMVVHGKVPVPPWSNNLKLHRMTPPEMINMPPARCFTQVKAGEIFSLVLTGADQLPEKEIGELTLRFIDENGRNVALSPYSKPHARREGKNLYLDLETSPYAMPGTYRWKLEGLTCEVKPGGQEQVLTILPGVLPAGQPGAKIPRYDGRNYMETPTGKTALFTYATSLPEAQRFYNWRHTGLHMYEIGISAGNQLMDGSIDLFTAEQQMMQILAGDPDATICVKLRVDVAGWWGSKYPGEVFVSNKGRRALQSFCSDQWVQDMENAMAYVMDNLGKRPVGKALSSMLVMGFRGGEFQLWGEDVGEYDCSEPAKREFAKWQKAQGYTELIELPHPALEYPFKNGEGFAEVRKKYFSFVAERHAANLIEFAKFFKNRYGDKYAFGFYFGYPQEHAGNLQRMLFAGHLGFRKVLTEAPIDLLSCPASYGLRRPHRSHAFMNAPDTAALFGIRSILENDIRNYAHPLPADGSGTTIYSMHDTMVNDSRLALLAACHNAIVRYYALGEIVDWFAPLPSINNIRKDNLRNMNLVACELGSEGQLAWAIDTMSWAGAVDAGFDINKWAEFACYSRDTVMRSGRSVAFVMVDDLINYPGRWKVVGIPAPGLLPAEKIAALEQQYGKLPEFKSNTGAVIIIDGKVTLVETREELWRAIATKPALEAGINTVWYVGKNFVGTWDGKNFEVKINE